MDGDMALLDMGAEYHFYGSDITCSFPVCSSFLNFILVTSSISWGLSIWMCWKIEEKVALVTLYFKPACLVSMLAFWEQNLFLWRVSLEMGILPTVVISEPFENMISLYEYMSWLALKLEDLANRQPSIEFVESDIHVIKGMKLFSNWHWILSFWFLSGKWKVHCWSASYIQCEFLLKLLC